MASGFDTCFCGHARSTHGNQGCVGRTQDQTPCECAGYIPVMAAIAQSLNVIATHIVDLKHVIAVAARVVENPNSRRIVTP